MQKEIKQTWFFQRPPQEVWDYLTKPELIEQWLMKSDFQPKVGHKFRFVHGSKNNDSRYDGATHCEVLEAKPFSRLVYTWNGGLKDQSRSYHSKVEWTLVPKENGTELLLQHNGFTVLEDILTHEQGWSMCYQRMGNLMEAVK